MRYYLETNSLYQLKKINPEILKDSFTSSLALFEILSGINKNNFNTRKKILSNVQELGVTVNELTPYEMIWNSFTALSGHKPSGFVFDHTTISDVIEQVSRYKNAVELKENQRDFKWYNMIFSDIELCERTLKFGPRTIEYFDDILKKYPNDKTTVLGVDYVINTRQDLAKMLRDAMPINIKGYRDLMIGGLLSDDLKEKGLTGQKILDSYTGTIEHFIYAQLYYFTLILEGSRMPNKNDLMDLQHLMYLENDVNYKIVSDDKIYKAIPNCSNVPIASVC